MGPIHARPNRTKSIDAVIPRFDDPTVERDYWFDRYVSEVPDVSDPTLEAMARIGDFERLASLLHHPSEELRRTTTALFWTLWAKEKGEALERELREGMHLLEQSQAREALAIFDRILEQAPDFAEAYNQRAIAHYLLEEHDASIRDCHEALRRNRWHFGAWHGLGLCYLEAGDPIHALVSLEKAIAIQPYAEANHHLLKDCRARLRRRHAS